MAAELKVGIGAETAELKAGLKDAEAQIKKFLDNVVTIGKVGEKLKSIGKDMSIGITAPIVALSTVALKAFSDLEGVRIAFNRLNDPTLLDNLRKATKGTTSDLELMQAAVKSEKFGLSTNALPTLLEYAGRVAKDTGQEVSYLVDSITTGIGRKSPLILDNLGISASQLKSELGGVSMEAASVAMVTEAVGRIAAKELAKMGKDTKTLSESWLQVKTAVNNSMGKIGEIISKNLDIGGIIDKLTGYINSAVSTFESFSPSVQKSILVVAGLVAAVGPLLVVIGSILAVLPSVVAGFGLVSLALGAVTAPALLLTVGLTALTAIIGIAINDSNKLSAGTKELANEQTSWASSLSKANAQAETQISKLDKLYQSTQNTTLSSKQRGEAVDALQKQFPKYFGNINDEAILNGKLSKTYQQLRLDIYAASRAKAAGAELDKRAETRLQSELEIREKLSKSIERFKNPQQDFKSYGGQGVNITSEEDKKRAANEILYYVRLLKQRNKDFEKADFDLLNIKSNGDKALQDLFNSDAVPNSIIDSGKKIKKASDKTKVALLDFGTVFKQPMNDLVLSVNSEIDKIFSQEKIDELGLRMAGLPATLKAGLTPAQIAIQEAGIMFQEALNQIIDEGIIHGITDAFDAMGRAMFSGGDILAAAGASILSTLGQFMSMLGKEMIKLGIGTEVLGALVAGIKKFLIANPGAAIALGAIAITAGAMLSASASRISGGSSGGSGGGSIPSGGGGGSQSFSSSYSSGGTGGAIELFARVSGNDLLLVTERARDKNTRLGG